ncbi:MAG: N-acetyl-gamma-glutamyl-phosphate reductase [Chloroflexi bacterium RBG_19FT_COMBO_47_15]|nr:MAG: N-acetyl-gamma-glutamyl-phosphate reductase [Chloroflexi bacterium RBG_19FT_COMBO_47_15]
MPQIKVGIINVTGYAGVELARLLYKHPKVKLCSITGRSAAGQKLAEVFPHLADIELTITAELDEVALVFSAMPHKASAEVILPFVERGIKVIDISADFRLKDASKYLQWYDFAHPAPESLQKAVYGLPEFHRAEIAKASLVANPGCYPTGALLALAPAVKEGLIEPDIIIDSKSGISGAGRTLSLSTHYAEATDNVRAYSMHGHRHLPEIVQELETLNPGFSPSVTFLPHLVPTSRGILSSCYAKPNEEKSIKGEEELIKLYRSYYKGEPFVRVVDKPPETKQTWGSNLCLVYPTIDFRTGKIIVISCLDNLVKGAAGQAIQNMNIMFGFSETDGLEALPVYP